MTRYLWLITLLAGACTPTRTLVKSDADLSRAIAVSDSNKSQPLDFLADEKLPNEEFVPPKDAPPPVEVVYKEFRPDRKARFRVQVFAGSAANAHKNYTALIADTSLRGAVYLVDDNTDGKWRVWTGNFTTHEEAETAKDRFLKQGYPDAWIHEMKGEFAPAEELFWVQVGSLSTENAANKLRSELTTKQKEAVVVMKSGTVWKIWVGGYPERTAADELKKKLQSLGYGQSFIVKGLQP